jgi:hypothetical protein
MGLRTNFGPRLTRFSHKFACLQVAFPLTLGLVLLTVGKSGMAFLRILTL